MFLCFNPQDLPTIFQNLTFIKLKQKTNSGAKKRFKVTGSGKIKRAKAFKRHLLGRKSKKRKEALSKSTIVFKGDEHRVKMMLGMA